MDTETLDKFIREFGRDSESQLIDGFYIYHSDEARFAVACLLMASESNERKAA